MRFSSVVRGRFKFANSFSRFFTISSEDADDDADDDADSDDADSDDADDNDDSKDDDDSDNNNDSDTDAENGVAVNETDARDSDWLASVMTLSPMIWETDAGWINPEERDECSLGADNTEGNEGKSDVDSGNEIEGADMEGKARSDTAWLIVMEFDSLNDEDKDDDEDDEDRFFAGRRGDFNQSGRRIQLRTQSRK